MVIGATEAPQAPSVESGAKSDQPTDGGGFLAMLTGIASSQPGITAQASESAAAESSPDGSGEAGSVTPVGQDQLQAAMPELLAEEMIPDAGASQVVEVGRAAEASAAVVETDTQAIIDALHDLAAPAESKPLPEAARQGSEITAQIVAARLNPMGQNARTGAVLLNADGSSVSKEKAASGACSKEAATPVMSVSRKPEQAEADARTRIEVEWQPTETLIISTSSSADSDDALGFAGGSNTQPEVADVSSGSGSQQAFGMELKTQMGTEPVVRQAQTAPAQAPQADPTLGEKMVGQIVKEVSLHKLGENTTLSIRLDPPELGTLRVSVTSQSGVLTTQLESPNAVVRGILETHLPSLKEALASAGVEISKFSVSSGTDFGAQAQRQQAWQQMRFAPSVAFAGHTQELHPELLTAAAAVQTQAAGYSWLA